MIDNMTAINWSIIVFQSTETDKKELNNANEVNYIFGSFSMSLVDNKADVHVCQSQNDV